MLQYAEAMIEIRLHQAGFIGGVVAAMQHNVNRIGYVGGPYNSASFRNVNSFAPALAVSFKKGPLILMILNFAPVDTGESRISPGDPFKHLCHLEERQLWAQTIYPHPLIT